MNYLLDTNVISELIKPQPELRVAALVDSIEPARVFLSVITVGELRKGIEKAPPPRDAALRAWLEGDLLARFRGQIVPVSLDVMLVWGELTGRLELAGTPMPAVDSLIAAIALHGGYTIVTRNDQDFRHSGARTLNPWRP